MFLPLFSYSKKPQKTAALYRPLGTVECCTAFASAAASVSTLPGATFIPIVLMTFNPHSIQTVRLSIFSKDDIRLAIG
jgi:hypothetical protein